MSPKIIDSHQKTTSLIASGNLTKLLKMAIYSEFSH